MSTSLFRRPAASGPVTILTVCTGNICRSPLAAQLLRMILADLDVEVHSAGTRALVGSPMPDPSLRIASELGVPDAASHRARQLTATQLAEADLVLTMSREHRRSAVELLPRASRVVFTLREFARLAAAVSPVDLTWDPAELPSDRMRRAVESAAQLRGTLPPLADPLEDDVTDPYLQTEQVYQRSAEQTVPAVNETAALLRRAVGGQERW